MEAIARAWVGLQEPSLVEAIARAFCGCHYNPALPWPCGCLRPRDREVLARWVERVVMRGSFAVVPLKPLHGNRAPGPVWIMGPKGRRMVDPRTPECWFRFCTRDAHHAGQHAGIVEAGRRLVELEQAISEGRLVWRA